MLHGGRALMYRERVALPRDGDCAGVAYRGDWPYGCGLLAGHSGDCVSYIPGGYLPPRLITVLDWFDARWRSRGLPWWVRFCPICGQGTRNETADGGLTVYCDADNAERDEVRWRFEPCGCEGREFAEVGA